MVKVTVQEGSKRRRSENTRVVYLMTKLQHCATVQNTFASRVFSTPVAPVVVVAPAGDGRMEYESSIDDDPFDQFFTYGAIDVSSGLQDEFKMSLKDDVEFNASLKSLWAQALAEMTQHALDPEFTFEYEEGKHITNTLEKLYFYMHNLKTYGEASPSMSQNSKTDGDGVSGASNLVAIPTTGAARDTASSRKRGCHEKMVDEHKRKASKGEQISTRNYLS